jgi:hypothetical protein
MNNNDIKSSDERFLERISDVSGLEFDGVKNEEEKKQLIEDLKRKRDEILKDLEKNKI